MKYTKFVAAAGIYFGFALYLYQPYLKSFDTIRYLLIANVTLGSLGCYLLSRRWVAGFAESLFAGAVYGFGPFSLGLAKFHPTAGLLVAAMPWLFCPAAFGPKARWRPLAVPLSTLPFLTIVLFFQISARCHVYPIPIQLKLRSADLAGLLAPLVAARRGMTPVGFYHVPIAALVIGFSMLLAARRYGIMLILAAATAFAFCDSFLNVSPVTWLAITTLCCSILIGAGMQGLICAGFADRKWVLVAAAIMGILAITVLMLATQYFQVALGLAAGYARLLADTGKMYILGAIAVTVLFFVTRARLRAHSLRQALLYTAAAVDIFLGARFIVDTIL
jgi:hypothetical protein